MASQGAAAGHIFTKQPRFKELVERGVIERRPPNGYDLDEVRESYIRHLQSIAAGRTATGKVDPAEERALLAREQREGHRIKNTVARGEYAPVSVLADLVGRDYAVVMERLRAVRGRLAGRDITPELVEDEINLALEELHGAGALARSAAAVGETDPGEDDAPPAAPEAQPDRVGQSVPARRARNVGRSGKVADKRPARRVRSDERRD